MVVGGMMEESGGGLRVEEKLKWMMEERVAV